MRPGYRDSSVPNCSAMTMGEWFGSMMPPEPTRIVCVPAARWPITTAVAALAMGLSFGLTQSGTRSSASASNATLQPIPVSQQLLDEWRWRELPGVYNEAIDQADRRRMLDRLASLNEEGFQTFGDPAFVATKCLDYCGIAAAPAEEP